MKFRSPTDQPLQIGLTSGHTVVITPEGNDVAAMFRREAIARGAVPVGIPGAEETLAALNGTADAPAADRPQAIQAALQAMLDGGEEGDFTGEGKPNLVKLKSRLGFAVTREEVDAAWAIVSAAGTD